MYALFKKELRTFLTSVIGYAVIVVFLVLTGLSLWVFPHEFNILDGIDASMQSLFYLAPWVFLFLIPAVTMRFFSEEFRTGTIELLYTKPISDFQIIFAKFLAGFVLVIISLLPTLIYYYTIHQLGDPVGNIDTGEMWGAYIGLFFLASAYVSIGVFCSSITKSQVVAFISSTLICFFLYRGFDSIGGNGWFGSFDTIILNLGIMEHYSAVSKGVVDSRDLLYFISVTAVFLLLTRFVLQTRKW